MVTLITVIHVIACIFLILVVLLQAGKGGGMGIAFGSSTSAQVFGGRGAGSFLERMTAGTAIVFMLTSMTLAWYASQSESAKVAKLATARKKTDEAKAKKDAEERAKKDAEERAKTVVPPATAAPKATVPTTTPTTAPAPKAAAPATAPSKAPAPATAPAKTPPPAAKAKPGQAAPRTP